MACKIMLLNCNGLYPAGSTVRGQVVCNFLTSQHIRAITIRLKGTEKVKFYNGKYNHQDEKILFDETKVLAPEGDIGPSTVEYPFALTLPEDIPTSYVGTNGSITYTLKATVDKPFDVDYTDKVQLPVILPQDLNKLPDRSVLSPSTYNVDVEVTDCCFSEGNVAMEVTLEKRAFTPGETIKIGVRIINMSRQNVDRIRAVLKMSVTTKSFEFLGTASETATVSVAETSSTGCGAHGEKHCDIELKVPIFDAVPNFYNCKLFSFSSRLKIAGIIGRHGQGLHVNIPTCLADIPIGGEEEYSKRFTELQALGPNVTIRTMGLYDL